jgi:hypothetical protein
MKKISLALILFLTACNPQPKQGADGYKFGEKQYENQTVKVNIVTYKSSKEIQTAAKAKGANYPNVVAFSELQSPYDTCTIHMIDPLVSYEPEFVGHEFLHCAYGQWHKDNNSR